MLTQLRPAISLTVLFTLLTGLAYPLAMTGIAQAVFPASANGSLIRHDDTVIGSSLIAQPVDGRVRSVAWAEEGPDYRVIELDDGRVITVDSVLWRRLGGDDLVGDRLEAKGATAHVAGLCWPLSICTYTISMPRR